MRNEWRVLTLPTYSGSVPVYSSSTKNWFQTQLRFCLCKASCECLGPFWGRSGVASADLSPQQLMLWTARSQTAQHVRRPQKLIWGNVKDHHKRRISLKMFWDITKKKKKKNAENEILNPCSLWFFLSFWCTKPRNPWCDYSDVILKDSLLMVLLHEEFLIPIREREIKQGSEDPSTIVDFLKKSCPSKPHYDACVLGG